jgi:carboxymethylenebutenolidase
MRISGLVGLSLSGLLALVVTLPGRARAQPETLGPLTVMEWDAGSIPADGADVPVTVVYPTGLSAPAPVVLVVHGNLRDGSYHMELARTLASRGMVAVVPDMPCGTEGCDHDANARHLSALAAWAVAESATAGSTIAGTIDPTRRGMIGHSFGALNSFLAAARDPEFDVWVGLDPEEDGSTALDAAPDVDIPTLHLMAEVDGLCNGNWGTDVYDATAAPHLRMTVDRSGHCDPESPSDSACEFLCSEGDRDTTPTFRRYTVAFVGCVLGVDAGLEEWIGGAGYDAQVADGTLTDVLESGIDGLDCGAISITPDAGIAGSDGGGSSDAGPSPGSDGGPRPDGATVGIDATVGVQDASSPRPDTGVAGESGGGGCSCRTGGGSSGRPSVAAIALTLVVIASRRRRGGK